MRYFLPIATIAAAATVNPSMAGFTVYQGNGSGWFANVPSWTTIDFEGFPAFTQITNQYESLGVHFTDSDGDWIDEYAPTTFLQDGWGLYGNTTVELAFDQPMLAFGSHFPGLAYFAFYSGQQLLYSSTIMGLNPNDFAGFTSSTAFDRVRITGQITGPFDPPDHVFFDNFYFSNVPGPGGALLLMVLGFPGRSRRRHRD